MRPRILLSILVLIIMATTCLSSQDVSKNQETNILYFEESAIFGYIHTAGWGVSWQKYKIKTIYKKKLKEFEFMDIRHPKEFKQQSINTAIGNSNPKSFKYGKINNFYNVNFMFGTQTVLTQKGRKEGVTFAYNLKYGPSLGLLKPYYLTVRVNESQTENIKYSEDNQGLFLNNAAIYGASGFAYGLGEIKLRPGIVLKADLEVDWSDKNEILNALEAGATFHGYIDKVDLMAFNEPSRFFFHLYGGLKFGKRK